MEVPRLMKVTSVEFPDALTNKIYVHITYLSEPTHGDTEELVCSYIEMKHGVDCPREVVYIDALWGRTVRICKNDDCESVRKYKFI